MQRIGLEGEGQTDSYVGRPEAISQRLGRSRREDTRSA